MPRSRQPSKLERQYLHIRESYIDRGLSYVEATARAAQTVNKQRRVRARRGEGPQLVGRGGRRQQWWPGKKRPRETFRCLKHGRRFKTKAAMLSHFRGRAHAGALRVKPKAKRRAR